MKKITFVHWVCMLVVVAISSTALQNCNPKPKGTVPPRVVQDTLSPLPIIDTTIIEDGTAPLVSDGSGMKKSDKDEKQKKEKVSCTMKQQKFNNRKRPKEEAPGGVKGKPPKGGGTTDTQVPTLNSDLTVPPTEIMKDRISLYWQAASDNKSGITYNLYRNGIKINLNKITQLGYVDIGLQPSTTYTYYYQAIDAAGNPSLFSNSIAVTTASDGGGGGGGGDPQPGSNNVIYLNFWGSTISNTMWNAGTFTVGEAGFVQSEIDEIITQVLRYFPLYNVTVTTNKAIFDAAEEGHKIEVIATEDYQWYGQAGGVAYINSFFWTDRTPAFVFSLLLGYNTHYVAEAIAHEAEHTLGLRHQVDCVDGIITSQYRNGWLMGVSYYVDLGIQGTGPSSLQCQTQDDIAKLTAALGLKLIAHVMGVSYYELVLNRKPVFAILPKQYKF